MGFSITGYYIGLERREFKNDDGSIDVRHSVNVAIGNLAYRVYMKENFDPADVADLRIGEVVTMNCRVYVGKNGKLSVIDGEF